MSVLAYIILYLLVFLIGSTVGSFLNVVVYRVPRKISFVKGRSHCTSCNKELEFRDMVPVFSWLFLKGRCRNCGAKISPRYPIVEALTGIFAILSVLSYGFTLDAILVFYTIAVLIAVAFVDIDTMTIPNGFLIALLIPGIILILAGNDVMWYERLIGFFAVSLPMFIIAYIVPNAFGGGDIKLMAVCGLILGWKNVLIAFFIGVLCAGVYAIIALAKKEAEMKSKFAFGPYLALGTAVSLLYGTPILNAYLNTFVRK